MLRWYPIAVVPLVLAAACGGGSPAGVHTANVSSGEFVVRADAVCLRSYQHLNAIPAYDETNF